MMRRLLVRTDKLLLALTVFMFLFGLLMIFSASSVNAAIEGNAYSVFIKQAITLIICFFVSIVVLRMPTSKYQHLIKILLYAVIIGLIFILVYGNMVKGVKGWIDIGFFSIQPSEFAKSVIIILMGTYYFKHKDSNSMIVIYKPLIYAAIICGLVFVQPDFGTMLIIFVISALIFFSIPIDKKYKKTIINNSVILLILAILMLFASGKQIFTDAQIRRFTFNNPCERYVEATGYQVCNGFIAIKNGGLFGMGLGNSTQKYLYLPASYTDFIFPVIVEELGLVVGIGIIGVYLLIISRILRIAKRAHNLMGSTIAYGTAVYLGIHIIINMIGVLALFPLTGVPLPFLSYGGSYALNLSIMLAIVQRIEIENKLYGEKKALSEGKL